MGTAHIGNGGSSGSHQSLTIDVDRLLSIQREEQSDEGLTIAEWADKLGFSINHARELIKEAYAQGVVRRGTRVTSAADHWSGRKITQNVFMVAA